MQSPEDIMLSYSTQLSEHLILARQTAVSGSNEQLLPSAAQAQEAQRLDEVRQAVNSRTEKLAKFMGDSDSSLVVGPVRQALIR